MDISILLAPPIPVNPTIPQALYSETVDYIFVVIFLLLFISNIGTAILIEAWKSCEAVIIFLFLILCCTIRIIAVSWRIHSGGHI
jgi:hypothetical protein